MAPVTRSMTKNCEEFVDFETAMRCHLRGVKIAKGVHHKSQAAIEMYDFVLKNVHIVNCHSHLRAVLIQKIYQISYESSLFALYAHKYLDALGAP